MRKAMLVVGMMSVLGGCEHGAAPDTPLKQEGVPTVSPLASAVAEGARRASASRDPESANGLTKRMLGAKAFTVEDFGAAPEGDAEAVIRNLEAQARAGSGAASYAIHLKLFQCSNLLKPSGTSSSIEGSQWEECKDLSPERLVQEVDWLRLAASQGHLGAQIRFASDAELVLGGISGMFKDPDAVKEYKRQAMEYLNAAAERGSVDALSRIADAHLYGLKVERDPVASYAYYMAMQTVDPHSAVPLNMRYLQKELTANQLEDANKRSKEIYNECCRN
ncbi:hypothetical protein [Stenotrophomonas oahuensis]|uniref:Sel1 repeat family protein n=1 Tax=Stenotrophomonas oahuensis TaxID=3003271 RepID=A0ABY9YQK7_9GAMM|nr:hypothetical protein [Stenotrophomonas sp. A5586]WNH52890.1 hypothetical protein PDM29_01075 [Stenotrophomonas sp. A5586]